VTALLVLLTGSLPYGQAEVLVVLLVVQAADLALITGAMVAVQAAQAVLQQQVGAQAVVVAQPVIQVTAVTAGMGLTLLQDKLALAAAAVAAQDGVTQEQKGGTSGTGAVGAVRIIWPGNTRSFPSTCTGNL
jgi:hypothetical protein